jgi:hypothetical protein
MNTSVILAITFGLKRLLAPANEYYYGVPGGFDGFGL